ncbi:MAG TPA: SDR family oxidoreductase [Acidimicrobiales bacterium]|nr:SDR family oxidoreductase [Acidimicrobiales bacterium]
MLLDGKVVVVSGVGPGLGREIAAVALREGASVMLGARTAGRLEEVAAGLGDDTRVGWQPTDITDADQCRRLVDAAAERFGRLDGVVNCAALDTVMGGLQDADFAQWRQVFDTNIIGTLSVCRAAIDHLKGDGGSIVLIGSQSMYWPQIPQMAYAASKGGLTSAMHYLAKELGPLRIRVNTVVPTWMWGPPVQTYVDMMVKARGVAAEEIIGEITRNMPLGEIPADEDVAEVVAFFLSDRARMVSDQSLLVNAGEFPH